MVELLRELRKTHSPVYCIIKAMIKDADEQPDEGTRRKTGGSRAAPVPVGMPHPSGM